MITIRELDFTYPGNKHVIKSLDLQLETGRIHGIAGLNGSGKTTFLNVLFGLLKADSGTISGDTFEISKRNMAYLTSESYFYSNVTGMEYLALFKNQAFDTEKWNKLFRLPLDQVVDEYSSGMKKKLALLGVIKMDKKLMILDEPFNNLDIETARIVRNVLMKMSEQGKTIIVTSHIIETLTNLCDFIHYLEKGKIRFSKSKKEFDDFSRELFESIENKTSSLIGELFEKQS
jgi:ABC-2 type transport system ATP-binding protein